MRALSIIGILVSLAGTITSIFVMTEARCHCYCNDEYYYGSSSVPDEAIGGSLLMMLGFVFFLVFSIVSTAISFNKKTSSTLPPQPIPPFQAQPQPYPQYPPYGQPFPSYSQLGHPPNRFPPQPQNPYQQPQNPYQQPQNPPPPQNPYQPPTTDPNNPPSNDPPQNPWAPK